MFKLAATTAVVLFSALAAQATTTAQASHLILGSHQSLVFEGINSSGAACSASIKVLSDSIVADVDENAVTSMANETVEVDSRANLVQFHSAEHGEKIRLTVLGGHVNSISVSKAGALYGSNIISCSQLTQKSNANPYSKAIGAAVLRSAAGHGSLN